MTDQTANKLDVSSADGSKSTMNFWLFTPEGYEAEGDKKWPLMIFLHGAGERGTDMEKVKLWGPPKRVATDPKFPFVLVSPQCPEGTYWITEHLDQLLDHCVANNNVDASRVYVTGLSMGGYGTWALSAMSPQKVAAAIPICGKGEVSTAAKLVDVPFWVFHGDADKVVSIKGSQDMYEAVVAAGGKQIKMTTYVGVGHNSWSETYTNPQIYDWLLSHKKPPR